MTVSACMADMVADLLGRISKTPGQGGSLQGHASPKHGEEPSCCTLASWRLSGGQFAAQLGDARVVGVSHVRRPDRGCATMPNSF